jgi:hypothetical protein
MAEISEAALNKAIDLANAADHTVRWTYNDLSQSPALDALARYIQQVSDAAKEIVPFGGQRASELLTPFILPEPVDPLLIEAAKFAESWAPEMVTPLAPARLERLQTMALAALKRGTELAK